MRFVGIFTLVLCFANAVFASDEDEQGKVLSALVSELNAWLDAETEYRDRARRARIKFTGDKQAEQLHGVTDRSGGKIRGLYDAEEQTIYLTQPWSASNPRDVSVLLHELVHHRQAGQHWYCAQAQEWRAYQIQAQWLAEHRIKDGFFWPAILLLSSCANRDIHPE